MKKAVLLAMVLVAGLALAKSFDTGYEPEGLDGLTKQKGVFKTTRINPDTDFSHYTKYLQREVILVVRDPGTQRIQSTGSLIGRRSNESIMPEYEELIEFKQIVLTALSSEMARSSGLEMVNDLGPNTLVVQPVVTDVVFTSSSKNKSEDGREFPELSHGTIVFDLIDGETGLIQGRMGERRRCDAPKDAEPTSGAWPNLAYWAESAASDFCQELRRIEGPTAGSEAD